MELLPAYVSYDFLEELTKNTQIDLLDTNSASDNKSRMELVQLLLKGVCIYLDKTYEEIDNLIQNKQINELLLILIKSERKKIVYVKDEFQSIVKEPFGEKCSCKSQFKQFFLSNFCSSISNKMEKESGMMFHTMSKPETYQRISQSQLLPMVIDEPKNWSFIKKFYQPHHSIIITDPYLIANQQNKHVVGLLENFIDNEIKCTYQITFFFSRGSFNKLADKIPSELSKRIKWIEEELQNKFRTHKIEVEWIIYSKDDFHDRFIISNSFMIYSGHSFDLIKND